jgi:hypothetical protein
MTIAPHKAVSRSSVLAVHERSGVRRYCAVQRDQPHYRALIGSSAIWMHQPTAIAAVIHAYTQIAHPRSRLGRELGVVEPLR